MDIFQIMGAFLASVLILFQIFDRLSTLRRSLSKLLPHSKCWWRMCKHWKYWKLHHPILSVINKEPLRIKKDENKYCMRTNVTIDVHNRDKIYPIHWRGRALLDIYHRKQGVDDSGYYRSFSRPDGMTELAQEGKKRLSFEFVKQVPKIPRPPLKREVKARLILESITLGSLKARNIRTVKFVIPVEWFDD